MNLSCLLQLCILTYKYFVYKKNKSLNLTKNGLKIAKNKVFIFKEVSVGVIV